MVAAPYLPAERMPEHPLIRLLRPLLDRVLGSHRSRGAPAGLPPADPALPYGGLVAAFAGSPTRPRCSGCCPRCGPRRT